MALTQNDIFRLRRKYRRKRYHPNPLIHRDKHIREAAQRRALRYKGINLDLATRRKFTELEMTQQWFGVCRLIDYFGGRVNEAANLTGFCYGTIRDWIAKGRISPLGAFEIGRDPDLALSKEELRPDISEEAWDKYVKSGTRDKQSYHRYRSMKKNGQRIE